MTSTTAVRPARGVRGIGLATIIVGIVFILAGAATWWAVQDELSSQDITVSDDASMFAGNKVSGPLTAYSEAKVIAKHVSEMSGGKTYAEMAQNDPKRDTVAQGSFLQASLYTSVIAFGVALLVMGLGVMLIILGIALRKIAGPASPAVASTTASGGLPGRSSGQYASGTASSPAGSSSVGAAPTVGTATVTPAATVVAEPAASKPAAKPTPTSDGPSEASAWTRSVAATPPEAAPSDADAATPTEPEDDSPSSGNTKAGS